MQNMKENDKDLTWIMSDQFWVWDEEEIQIVQQQMIWGFQKCMSLESSFISFQIQ